MANHLFCRCSPPAHGHAQSILITLILLLLCLVAPARSQVLNRGTITVRFAAGWEEPAGHALDLAEKEIPWLARRLGLPQPASCTIYLANGLKQLPPKLARMMPDWAAGLALPFRRILLVRLDRLNTPNFPGGFREVIKHELVHLVMGGMAKEDFYKLHWWFHEGCAQVLSTSRIFLQEAELGDLALAGRLRSVFRLGIEEDSTRRATDLAYQEAYSFATFLERKQGEDFFARLIAAIARHEDFNQAFLATTQSSYVTLEENWKELLISQPRATIQKLARDFFWYLLILTVPLVALAVRRRWRRDRKLEESWQLDEFEQKTNNENDEVE